MAAPVIAATLAALLVAATALALGAALGPSIPLAAAWLGTGCTWAYTRSRAAAYRPVANGHWEPATVVAPAFRESAAVLERAVSSWLEAGAAEVVLVIPADETLTSRRSAAAFRDPRVRVVPIEEPTKRNCIAAGTRVAGHPIVVLADSDTVWQPDTLENLLMPFADLSVGGVGTHHRVLGAESSVWRRVAESTLEWEFADSIPATAGAGGVATLKGRTVAYRRDVLRSLLPELVGERFLGRRCVSGDDGRLTWLLLQRGYRTTHQSSAVVWTMMPANARGFLMQRVRWARNSYRCYLRAGARGWLFRQPLVTQLTVAQKVLFPVSVTAGLALAGQAAAEGHAVAALGWAAWTFSARGIRVLDHVRGGPARLRDLPLTAATAVPLTAALKYYGFFTMTRQDWMTRRRDRVGAEGQTGVPEPAFAAGQVGSSLEERAEA